MIRLPSARQFFSKKNLPVPSQQIVIFYTYIVKFQIFPGITRPKLLCRGFLFIILPANKYIFAWKIIALIAKL